MAKEQDAKDQDRLKDDPKPGEPKPAHRDYVSGGRHENKDTRRELREKH